MRYIYFLPSLILLSTIKNSIEYPEILHSQTKDKFVSQPDHATRYTLRDILLILIPITGYKINQILVYII